MEIKPHLQPLATTLGKCCHNLWGKIRHFWARKVTQVNSYCYQNKTTSDVFKEQEDQKKHKYQQQVLDVEVGSFTPLVFGTNGGMGNQFQHFLKHLTHKIAPKDTEPYNTVIAWLRMQIFIKLLTSAQACMRGSRTPLHSKKEHSLDFKISMKGYSHYFQFTLYFNNAGVF